jgi:ABC-type uncharacterized transport system, permease component
MQERELKMLRTLKKYFSIYAAMFKASVISDLEYRVNFLTRIVSDIFWYVAQIATFEVLYLHTPKIGDWNVAQFRVFLGLIFVIDALYMIILHDNLENFTEKVRKGDLDLLLAKPVNSQFMISLQKASTAMAGNLLLGLGWLTYSLSQLPEFNPLRLLWLIILIPCSLTVIYSMRFMVSSTATIFTRSENLQFMWYQLYKIGMRPDSMYFPWFKWIILTVLPVGVVASVPARALLDPPNYFILLWPLILSPILLYGTSRFWRYCLTHYSSASS